MRKSVESGYQRFVICEEKERTTFEVRPEVDDSRVGCLEITVKCRITLLGRRKFGREKGQGLPMVRGELLEHTADVRI